MRSRLGCGGAGSANRPFSATTRHPSRSIRLQRGELVSGAGQAYPPLGELLQPGRPLGVFDEELPRSGLQLTRAWQFARTATGASISWTTRRAQPGRGEAASGLRFDQLATE